MLRAICLAAFSLFFFNDTATTEIYTLSLHDALPIYLLRHHPELRLLRPDLRLRGRGDRAGRPAPHDRRPGGRLLLHHHAERSEEHTSELQSRQYLVCRLLLEKKKIPNNTTCTS